jgi:hypothetical protein
MQNNNQAQQSQQLSQEELQKTQVLNLKDFEEVAKFEKRTSKKPAIIVALIGVICLTFGTTFQIATILSSKNVESTTISKRVSTEDTVTDTTTNLVCSVNTVGNADGTDTNYKITYTFTNDELTSFIKQFTVSPTEGSTIGEASVEGYVTGYQPYTISISGYNVSVTKVGNSLTALVQADYTKLDMTTFPEYQQTHFTTSVDYVAGTSESAIKNDMTTKGYTCE